MKAAWALANTLASVGMHPPENRRPTNKAKHPSMGSSVVVHYTLQRVAPFLRQRRRSLDARRDPAVLHQAQPHEAPVMGHIRVIWGLTWGCIGINRNKMETTILGLESLGSKHHKQERAFPRNFHLEAVECCARYHLKYDMGSDGEFEFRRQERQFNTCCIFSHDRSYRLNCLKGVMGVI